MAYDFSLQICVLMYVMYVFVLQDWYKKTPLGKARAKLAAGEDEDGGKGKKGKGGKKGSGKKGKKKK